MKVDQPNRVWKRKEYGEVDAFEVGVESAEGRVIVRDSKSTVRRSSVVQRSIPEG